MNKQTIISLLFTTSITLYGMNKSPKTNITNPAKELKNALTEMREQANNNLYSALDGLTQKNLAASASGPMPSEFSNVKLFLVHQEIYVPKNSNQKSKL